VEPITSRRNPIVTRFRKASGPRATSDLTIVLEGPTLIADAFSAGVPLELVAISTSLVQDGPAAELIAQLKFSTQLIPVSPIVMDAISPVPSPSGLIALATTRPVHIEDMLASSHPFVVGLDGVQDPGNTGAVIRTVEAGGASGVVTIGGADPYSWKALRGSMGSIFRIPVTRVINRQPIIHEATKRGWKIIATAPNGGTCMTETDLKEPCLLLLGSEGQGLNEDTINAAHEVISIPMREPVESLNLAVTAALVIYEAARQRCASTAGTASLARHLKQLS
tara:strand:- start:590 stop:1429 length:840 start_codon:yes stop_codon:yes gene_type:complete